MRAVTAVMNLQFSAAKQCIQWTTVVKTRLQSFHSSSSVIPLQNFAVYTHELQISDPYIATVGRNICSTYECLLEEKRQV